MNITRPRESSWFLIFLSLRQCLLLSGTI